MNYIIVLYVYELYYIYTIYIYELYYIYYIYELYYIYYIYELLHLVSVCVYMCAEWKKSYLQLYNNISLLWK